MLEQRIRENCRTFLNHAKKYLTSRIYYSYKANYLAPICRIIKEEGIGAEIATEYEYEVALQSQVDPNSIILSAPYKPKALLQKVVAKGIGLILLSHPDEVGELTEVVTSDEKQAVGIRLRSPRSNKQLGFSGSAESILELVDLMGKAEHLTLTTLQLHIGTQLDEQIFRDGIEHLINVANQFEQKGFSISQLDFGGGFPEASNLTEEELDNLFLLLFETLKERGWANVTCIFEPGRYLVGDAGLVLTQVINRFEVEGEPWIMLNTGTHHCPKFSNSKFRFELIDHMSDPHDTPISIAGCLPTDLDVFSKRLPFTESVKKGDFLAIFNAGAYTFSWSTRFSYPFPPIILVKGEQFFPLKLSEIVL
ncbi:MAG: hypothetical protein LUQ65_03780 [Candidatus Helarchaeota archaeon]|nr:hypothetical protein [Candidatus Helarchaeota archaeon]